MEPPASVTAENLRDEKVKLLRAIEVPREVDAIDRVVRAQYSAGVAGGARFPAYRDEEGVDPASTTETYVALRLMIDNWRWAGVPVYIRTGKRLAKRTTEVAFQFQSVPHLAFGDRVMRGLRPDALVLRIQPDEGISLFFGAKVPGDRLQLETVSMNFAYAQAFGAVTADAYERLLHDAMIGDPTLFVRTDEVEQAWSIVDPLLDVFAGGLVPLDRYEAGSWGPRESDRLLDRDRDHRWRDL